MVVADIIMALHSFIQRTPRRRNTGTSDLQGPLRPLLERSQSMPNLTDTEFYAYPVKFILDRYINQQDIDKLTSVIVELYRSAHRKLYDEKSVYNRVYGDRDHS